MIKKQQFIPLTIGLLASFALVFSGCENNDFDDAADDAGDAIEDTGDEIEDATN